MALNIKWNSANRKAQNPPDPRFPNGVVIDAPGTSEFCKVKPEYPAPECGQWLISCSVCGASMMVTAAGRIDDPVEIHVSCKGTKH